MLSLLVAVASVALSQDTDTTFSVRQGQRLEVSDFGGEVVIKAWRQNSVRVRATHSSRDRVLISTDGATISINGSSRHGPAMVTFARRDAASRAERIPGARPTATANTPSQAVVTGPSRGKAEIRRMTTEIGDYYEEALNFPMEVFWEIVKGVLKKDV